MSSFTIGAMSMPVAVTGLDDTVAAVMFALIDHVDFICFGIAEHIEVVIYDLQLF